MESLYAQSSPDDGMAMGVLIALSLLGLAWIIVLILTVVSIIRSNNYSASSKTGWALGIIGIPFTPFILVMLWHLWARKESGAPNSDAPTPGYPPQPHAGTSYGPQPGIPSDKPLDPL